MFTDIASRFLATDFAALFPKDLTANSETTTTAVAAASGLVLGSLLLRYLLTPHPLDRLPSPKPSSYILGHLMDNLGTVANWASRGGYPEPFLSWVKQYGGAIHLREFFNHSLLLTDPKAVQHVLASNEANYPRDSHVGGYFAVRFLVPVAFVVTI
ncbi:hypothetical protein As57867_005706, partial [Aphanomyces stellatus]